MDRSRTASALHYGDAFVAHSRNACADLLLSSKLEWMLTIDDDMVVPFGNADWFRNMTRFNFPDKFMGFNALDRLMSHGKSLVGALYFGRSWDAPPVYNEGASDKREAQYARSGPHDVCKPTRWVGTGCMLTHRSVFEDIEKRFPIIARVNGKGGHWYTSHEASIFQQVRVLKDKLSQGKLDGQSAYDALQAVTAMEQTAKLENTLGFGEDVTLCQRASVSGHQPHIDMGLICGHIGYTVFGPHNTGGV